ncbi:ATP-binding cassette sub-family C member 4-like [Bacillus rossius redtenbacheri]|uniref:ATP-binding cassette sub-family C member 4-like n=1 Tax=Bacillus rossius redtenbacheri TaxID=93214 RepID=UPI002FDDA3F3
MDHSKKHTNQNPLLKANPISKLVFFWLRNLFSVGLHRDLEQSDLYNAVPTDESDRLGDEMEMLWKENIKSNSKKKKPPSLLRVIIKMFKWEFMKSGVVVLLVSCVFRVSQPLLLASLINYFSPGSTTTKTTAYVYAGSLLVTTFVSTLLYSHSNIAMMALGMRVRVACCSLMYRKILRMSRTASGQTTTGQIVNLMSNDVNRFDRAFLMLHYVWILPIQTVIIMYFLWQFVGVASLVGVGALFLQSVPAQGYMGKLTSKLRLKIAVRTDERVKLMNEIISGIQVIKMYAWEKPFEKMVAFARRREINIVKQAFYLRGVYFSAMVFTERLTLFLTLLTYVLLGNQVTADKVFPLAQFFNILQLTMAIFFPQAVQMAAEANVSVKRLQNFLAMEEIQPKPVTNGIEKKTEKLGLKLTKASAKWIPDSIAYTLHDLNVNLPPGKLCAVIGPVGSGKSSLFQLILGELSLSGGSLAVEEDISYASQEPWLFVGSVRQNILFGQAYEPKRYKEVVRVCALQRDFELFPNGDKTVVGERGVSLSGGQRARINLARCVYRRADVYLLDDPLSAVDTHVSKHLLEECISGFLASKTRLLATHQLQHIKDADLILVLNNGRIEAQGTYDELLAKKINFTNLLTTKEEEEEVQDAPILRRLRSSISENSSQDGVDEENDILEPDENEELLAKGAMKASVYMKYFTIGGSCIILTALFLSLIIGQSASSGSDYWVTYWTNMELERFLQANCAKVGNLTEMTYNGSETAGLFLDPDELDENSTIGFTSEVPSVTGMPRFNTNNSDDCSNFKPVPFSTEVSLYIYGAFIAGSVLLTLLRSIFFFNVCMSSSVNLHNTMFSSILQGTMRFFDTNPSGRVLNRFSKDVGTIDEVLPTFILDTIQVFLVMSGILTMVAIVNYYLIIPMLCVAPLYYLMARVYMPTAQGIKRLEGTTRSPVFSHVSATFNGLATIRSAKAQDVLRKEFDSHQDLHTSAWYLTIVMMTAFGVWLDFLSNVFIGVVILNFLVVETDVFGANVGLAIAQSLILSGMLQYGIRQLCEVVNLMTAVERVLEYTKIDKEKGIESEPGKKPPSSWPYKGAIQFDHASLRYSDTDPPVLKDLNFSLEPAEKVGIVGRTGAGKSSLISALFRLAKLEGSVRIDGLDTQDVGLHDLRSRISIIPQEPVLFSASLRSNLDPFQTVDDDKLWSVLEEVELKESVESLDFFVTAGGSNFSTGQRQLICLARAILRNNKILIMDEATANVDPQTDALIQATIRRKFKDCTVLTIAHRLNTIMDSDKVLVMDAGTMVEFGHPHILLQNHDGHFYKMVQETGKSMAEQLAKISEEAYQRIVRGPDYVAETPEATRM